MDQSKPKPHDDEAPAQPAGPQMPTPTDEHRKLHVLAGEWVGEEKLSPSPWGPGGAAVGRFSARVALDGFFVLQDYQEEKDGRVAFRGHAILGWDAQERTYTWYWIDTMGFVPAQPSRGHWAGDALTLQTTTPRGMARHTFRFPDEGTFQLRIENSFDGGANWRTFMEGTYRRA